MSGHSKWSNIKHRKGAVDAKRAVIFTKIGKEIQVAVRKGGADPASNPRLKDIINKAKQVNMPNDNIKRSIQKASGAGAKDDYEEITYEGYGVGGVCVMVKCLTDNRNRSAADVRHLYHKYGGNMGTTGCVSFMFQTKGRMVLSKEDNSEEEQVMLDALNAGAEDFVVEDEVYLIYTSAEEYASVLEKMENLNYEFLEQGILPIADTQVTLQDEEARISLEKMLEALDAHDDVTEIYHNCANVNF